MTFIEKKNKQLACKNRIFLKPKKKSFSQFHFFLGVTVFLAEPKDEQ
jgi:hypothetical protein